MIEKAKKPPTAATFHPRQTCGREDASADHKPAAPHVCPFTSEILFDDTLCTCCVDCELECSEER